MISLASVQSNNHSQAGGGFDFGDNEVGPKISKHVKRQHSELLAKVDNYTILQEYSINLPEKAKPKISELLKPEIEAARPIQSETPQPHLLKSKSSDLLN